MNNKRVVFVGSKALGASVLNALFSISPQSIVGAVTYDDSNDIRCALDQFQDFKNRTDKPLWVLKKASELDSAIAELKPDLCIVVGWYWMLKPVLLSAVSHGWLGIHASLLPKYRGGSPLVWALINGETETGLSLFYFDEGMDTGDIVAQRKISIYPEHTIADLLTETERLSLEMIRAVYPLLLNGNAPRFEQDHSQATYAALRKPSDGKIDWNQPAYKIYDFVRAQSHPYPGAFCNLDERTIRVWSASPFDHLFYGSPGQVVLIKDDHAVVTCGNDTALCLKKIQAEGFDDQDASAILKFGQRLN